MTYRCPGCERVHTRQECFPGCAVPERDRGKPEKMGVAAGAGNTERPLTHPLDATKTGGL